MKNSGNDSASGLNDESAWRTIGKVNSFSFTSGDTVLFKRGDTFSDKGLRLSNVENFTIADYGVGKKPLFDGNIIKPIYIYDSRNVIIRNIDISGQEWNTEKAPNLGVTNVEGVIIDGIYGNGHSAISGVSKGKTGISIYKCSGVIEVKNCELFNWGPYDLLDPENTTDFMGLSLNTIVSGEYKVHNNKIYNVTSDTIHVFLTTAKGEIYNNILYNAGEDGIDVKGSQNVDIYNNEFYRTQDFVGEGGSGSGGLPTFIVVHIGGEFYSRNNTIRSNYFHNGECTAVKLGKAENTNIYDNVFFNVRSALFMQNYVKNTKFHYNIIENPESRILSNGFDGGSIYENNSHTGTEIFNNTIFNEKGSAKHLITLGCSNQTKIYNNIVYQGNSSDDSFGLYHNSCGTEPVIHDNYWYNPHNINRIMYSRKIYTLDMQDEWNEKHLGDKFSEPDMNYMDRNEQEKKYQEEEDYSFFDEQKGKTVGCGFSGSIDSSNPSQTGIGLIVMLIPLILLLFFCNSFQTPYVLVMKVLLRSFSQLNKF